MATGKREATFHMTMQEQGSTNGAHGGVGHLLRMAKTQCGVSMAFAALRKADGGFAIATFPTLTADPTWSVEAIDELVRQTWEDPHLAGGSVVVRSGRVLKGMWTGQGHHIKLAAAALSDPEAPEHPWGLLCVAEPLAGHFEQDQLNLLGNLAVRLTSYLRARQQVLAGSITFETTEVPIQVATEATAQPVEQGVVAEPGPPSGPEIAAELEVAEPAFDELFGPIDDEHPLDRAADAFAPAGGSWGGPDEPRQTRADDWEFLGLDEIEWVEAIAPDPDRTAEPPPVTSWAPEGLEPTSFDPALAERPDDEGRAPAPSSFGTREDDVPQTPATVGSDGLDALLGPDPESGLATLPTLMSRLSTSLAHVRNHEGTVGIVLIEVSVGDDAEPLGPIALSTVAGRLTNHLRDRDMVARVGPKLFAILVDLRADAVDLAVIRDRALIALTAGTDPGHGGLRARSGAASAGAGSTASAEDLLRQAADELRAQ